MTKSEFLSQLREAMVGLSQDEVEERLTFYSEMIDDRIEEGFSEENAVKEIGSNDELIARITADIPHCKDACEGSCKKWKAWEKVFLWLRSPIWLTLWIVAGTVIFSVCIVLWSVSFSLWVIFGAFVCSVFAGVVASVVCGIRGNLLAGAAMLSAAIALAGVSIYLFYVCKYFGRFVVLIAKKIWGWIKNSLMG